MPSDEQRAAEGLDQIERLYQKYLLAAEALNASRDAEDSPTIEEKLLSDFQKSGTDFFNRVESVIAASAILGANRNRFWATDLAATAVNVLDNIPRFYERAWSDGDRLGVQRLQPGPGAFYAMQNAATIYQPDQVASLRKRFEDLGLPIEGFKHPTPMTYKNWEKIAMGITVVVFMLLMLAIGVFVKNSAPFNILLFRTVLALVGGAFGAIFVPGLIRVHTQIGKFAVTAGGAMALVALIYLVNPPELVKNSGETTAPSQTVAPSPSP